jgi:hypothetical protein
MNTPDIELVLSAVEDARRILGEYIEPDRLRDPGRRSNACWSLSTGRIWYMPWTG